MRRRRGRMDDGMGLGIWAYWLVVGFPTLLFLVLVLLGRLERWMIQPDERAAEVARLLEHADRAEEVEDAVTKLLTDLPRRRTSRGAASSRLATAAARARRGRRRSDAEVPSRRER